MIHAVQTGHPPPVSFAAEPPQARAIPASQFSDSTGRVAIPEAFQRPDPQSPNYFSRLKTAILKQILAQDSPVKSRDTDASPSTATRPETSAPAGARPKSMAQTIVVARSDGAPSAVVASIEAERPKKAETAPQADAPAETPEDPPAMREMAVLTKGVQIPKLDAGWRIIPTAEFIGEGEAEKLELLI